MTNTVPPPEDTFDSASRPGIEPQTCDQWIGAESRYCGSTDQVRRYLTGMCCPEHTPARLAGRPEPPASPAGSRWWIRTDGSTVPLTPTSTSSVHDDRAVSTGRRVSGARRRAAHQGEQYELDLDTRRDAA